MIVQPARVAILAGVFTLLLYTSGKALSSAFDSDAFPESLAVKVELLPLIFPLHMITGALALLLIPLAYALRRQKRRHRMAGRMAAITVAISGATAFPVAWAAPVTFGSAAGFTAQGSVWLLLLALGIWNIRHGRIAAHRACMLMMAATTLGAVFFRIYLALWAMFGTPRQFDLFYACDAWIAWLLPLATCGAVLAARARSPHSTVRLQNTA